MPKTAAGHLWPMCIYGWNRSNGHRLSILRGSPGMRRRLLAVLSGRAAWSASEALRHNTQNEVAVSFLATLRTLQVSNLDT